MKVLHVGVQYKVVLRHTMSNGICSTCIAFGGLLTATPILSPAALYPLGIVMFCVANAFFLFVECTGHPSVILQYKIQPGKKVPVSEKDHFLGHVFAERKSNLVVLSTISRHPMGRECISGSVVQRRVLVIPHAGVCQHNTWAVSYMFTPCT